MSEVAMSITRRCLFGLAAAAPALLLPRRSQAQDTIPEIAKGPFDGAESLKQYRIPEWFRDYKFGMWAHWGPQSAAEFGDWYARNMYMQDSPQNKYHVEVYGHPSKVGFKDVALTWHGRDFDAEHLIQLYKKAGAKYFMSMGVHHDNFDLWNSTHQPRWNAVATGPKKDVVGLFAAAARKNGLKFAVSEHLSNSYNWLAVSHGEPVVAVGEMLADGELQTVLAGGGGEQADDVFLWAGGHGVPARLVSGVPQVEVVVVHSHGHEVFGAGFFVELDQMFGVDVAAVPCEGDVVAADLGGVAVDLDVIFVLRAVLHVHVARVPIAEFGGGLGSPMGPHAELVVAEPLGNTVLLERFGAVERAFGDFWNSVLRLRAAR